MGEIVKGVCVNVKFCCYVGNGCKDCIICFLKWCIVDWDKFFNCFFGKVLEMWFLKFVKIFSCNVGIIGCEV